MGRIMCIDPVIKNLNILRKEGLLPIDEYKLTQILKITFHVIFFSLAVAINVANMAKAIENGNDMELNRATCVLIPVTQLISKGVTILINKEYFLLLLGELKSDVFNNHSIKLNVHIEFVYKISDLLRKYYILACGAFLFVVAALPFALNVRLMMPAPFDMGKYMFFYKIFHFLMAIYLATNSISVDVTYISLLALCIAQLNILEEKLIDIFEESRKVFERAYIEDVLVEEEDWSNTKYTVAEQDILKECIVHHEKINKFVYNLNKLLSLPLFVQYLCGCFVICNSILLVTIMGARNTVDIAGIIAYSVITFSQMAVYHWLGNEIDYKSSNIMDACYLSDWYKLNLNSQKSLLTLMERTKRPFMLHLYKLVFISLKSLGEIVRWAYSLFALIKARYK